MCIIAGHDEVTLRVGNKVLTNSRRIVVTSNLCYDFGVFRLHRQITKSVEFDFVPFSTVNIVNYLRSRFNLHKLPSFCNY